MNVRINGRLFNNSIDASKYLLQLASRQTQVKIEPNSTCRLSDLLSCELPGKG